MDAEERRAERRARLLDAGLELLGTGGWQATTVTAVSEQAGLIPRYFYESFGDRDALLVSVFDGIIEEVTAEAFRLTEGHAPNILKTLRAAAAAWVKVVADDPRKGRVAFAEALGSEALMRRRWEATHRYSRLLAGTVRAAHAVPPGREQALNVACKVAAGGQVEAMMCWLDGSLKTSAEGLIEEYSRVCAAGIKAAIAAPRKRAS
jgi:AcrR family transcriptional regulator